MGDSMRWRYGDTNPVASPVEIETLIEVGDMLWQDLSGFARPANLLEPRPTTGQDPRIWTTEAFVQRFLGVALQRSRVGESAAIRVATTGAFSMDCDRDLAETVILGMLIGPGWHEGSGRLTNQVVRRALRPSEAIGRVTCRAKLGETSILVAIASTVMTGGVYVRGCG